MEPVKRSTLAISALAITTSLLLVACGFPRPANIGDDENPNPNANACCVTPAECAQLGATSPEPCPLGVCVHNVCTTAAGSCDGDEDCSGDTPVCVSQTCSVCRTSASCPDAAPVCDDTSHDCRACVKDSECDSGACDLGAGTCVGRGAILYASPGGTAADPCTTTSPCSLRRAAELVDADHAHIVMLPGSYTDGAAFGSKKATVVGNGATISLTRGNASIIFIFGGSSIHMRNFNTEEHLGGLPDTPVNIISLDSSDLTIDNMQANGIDAYAVGPENLGNANTVTIRHSTFIRSSLSLWGHLAIDECVFLAGGPDITGGIEMTNSIIMSGVTESHIPQKALRITEDRDHQLESGSNIFNNTFIGGNVTTNSSLFFYRRFSGNIFYNHGTIGQSSSDLYDYNLLMPSQNVGGAGNTTGDPMFVDAANNDFHLKPGSPARDAGDPGTPPTSHDFDGVSRPQGTRSDIGAFEYVP